MIQELEDLKTSILEGRYQDALTLVEQLDGMSRQAKIDAIESQLVSQGCFILKANFSETSPPAPLLQGEGRRILNMKSLRDLKILITPPSLQGKGVGGLGH